MRDPLTPRAVRSEVAGARQSSIDWLTALRTYLAVIAAANLLWETVHLPLYTIWRIGTVNAQLLAVVHCTAGDVLIALASLVLALLLFGSRAWPAQRFGPVLIATVIF